MTARPTRTRRHAIRPCRRRPVTVLTLLAGVGATGALALSMNGTLAAFTAQLTNSNNTAAVGTVVLRETYSSGNTTTTCTSTDNGSVSSNSSTCATINKLGGSLTMTPGATVSTTVTMTNTGSADASSFTIAPGACTQSRNGAVNGTATDMCAKVTVSLYDGDATQPIATVPLNYGQGQALGLTPLKAGESHSYRFVATFTAGSGNEYQGLTVSEPLVWTLTSGS